MKKSITGGQTLNLNYTDFERAGLARKAGNRFSLDICDGRAENVFNAPELAKELAAQLLQDATIKELFGINDYQISMNTKYVLSIKCIVRENTEEKIPEEVLEQVD